MSYNLLPKKQLAAERLYWRLCVCIICEISGKRGFFTA
jgi:hypothetical protein